MALKSDVKVAIPHFRGRYEQINAIFFFFFNAIIVYSLNKNRTRLVPLKLFGKPLTIAGGEIKAQNVTINSSGNYTAQDLESAEAEVRLNSNGSATIWVQDHLKAILSSSGDLRYRGDPTLDATTNSSGDVIQISE